MNALKTLGLLSVILSNGLIIGCSAVGTSKSKNADAKSSSSYVAGDVDSSDDDTRYAGSPDDGLGDGGGGDVIPPRPTPTPAPIGNDGDVNCAAMDAQYKGVIPVGRNGSGFVTERLQVEMKSFPKVTYNYPISAEAQAQLDSMHGDIGAQLTLGARGTGNWNRLSIPAGTVYSYKIKTSDYNFPIYYRLSGVENPDSPSGTIITSVSKCPGYFISPDVLEQKSGYDHYNTGNFVGDQKFRNCVTVGSQTGSGLEFGVGGNTQYICRLEKNQTYYINISAGNVHPDGLGPQYPHIGRFNESRVGSEMSQDFTMYPFGHLEAVGNVGNNLWITPIVKNRAAYYSEAVRVSGLFQAAAQARVNQCRHLIDTAPLPRTGRECSSLAMPVSPYHFE